MAKDLKQIIIDGVNIYAEPKIVYRKHNGNFYFDCQKCKNNCYDGEGCVNFNLVDDGKTKRGVYKYYCMNYEVQIND